MTLLFQDGFDSGIHKWTSNTGTSNYSTTGGVYGEGAITFTSNANDLANVVRKVFKTADGDTSNPLTRVSFFLRTNTAITTTSIILEIGDQSAFTNTNCRIALTSSGTLVPYRTGQNVTTITGNTSAVYPRIDDGNWHHVELETRFDTNPANGKLDIYVDGANVFSYAGNTNLTGNFRRVDYIQLGNAKNNANISYDDVIVWDDNPLEGNVLTGLAGPMRIYTLRPTADTGQADSTPSTGVDRFAMVDDVGQPDGDGTYTNLPIYGKDIYDVSDLPIASANVRTATISLAFNSSTYGRANVRPVAIANGVTMNGNTFGTISRTYVTPTIQFDISRDFGNSNARWTTTSISSLQIGVENVG